MKRRNLISAAAATAASLSLRSGAAQQEADMSNGDAMPDETRSQPASHIPRVSQPGTMRGEMLYREPGSTSDYVSVIGLGGSPTWGSR